ncbi:beta-galactosidase [Glycomyces buryatensis]|uniref:Beta-galactosidase n=1 Tax=Glycomyces buryatensis TaxID=2570927 RepID=A0A4S8QF40_9ACTN|nr:beta-galactosidase [Glycomyces buryatensis]THV41535.1 beta-galactosidase [Glycomyces buryatensis]
MAIVYGGDYNPEQWDRAVWAEDMRLMREAGVNRVSVGIFSWALFEPEEGRFEFEWFDEVLDLLAANGIEACLATPTASPPPWFAATYPEAVLVDAEGRRLTHGSRQGFDPSSDVYLAKALAITEQIARRYADHPAVVLWHLHNEYGCHNARSYSQAAAAKFRIWLRERYGDLDGLNAAWGTAFWSQAYSSWDQIYPPLPTPSISNPGQVLDFKRFSSHQLVRNYRAEAEVIRRHSDKPLTTNFMTGSHPDIDLWEFAGEVDVVATDHYLIGEDPHINLGFAADYARSLGAGKPWILMEHSTSAVNWQGRNRAKAPREMLRNSMTHLARGADAIMFFQWRASKQGAEKWHSGMVPHAGTDSKIWREVCELGARLGDLSELEGSTVKADTAILWDFPNRWAQEHPARPTSEIDPQGIFNDYYAALWRAGITCDVAEPEGDLSGYRFVVVPAIYLLSRAGAENLRGFVAGGGTVLVTPYSGIADETDTVYLGGYPGALLDVVGVRSEEFYPLVDGPIELASGGKGTIWSETAEARGAEVRDTYALPSPPTARVGANAAPMTATPAWTVNRFGEGTAHYLTTFVDADTLDRVIASAAGDAGVGPVADAPVGVEVVRRSHPDGRSWLLCINHLNEDVKVKTEKETIEVPAGEVVVHAEHA